MSLAGISCVAYIRVSTEKQVGETKTSLADQEAAITALATTLRRPVERWYRDEGASGATVEKRPALRSLLADCEASPRRRGNPGLVLVLNDSRWGRFPNPEEATYWRIHLEKLGWLVRFAEHDDTENLPIRAIMRAMVSGQATQKREDVRANAKRGSRGTAALGFWGSRTPYGYRRKVVAPAGRERVLAPTQRKAPDEKVILVPEPTEAAVVREMFRLYATGEHTLASLVLHLRATVPSRRWTRAAVRMTLNNPAYLGDIVSGRVASDKAERSERPRRPESEWIVKPDAHEALVSRALFARVQALLARNGTWGTKVRAGWLLTGLVRCRCGQPMVSHGGTTQENGKVSRNYRCRTATGIPYTRCEYAGTIKKEWLEDAVLETVGSFVSAPAQRARLLAALDRQIAARRNAPATSRATLERERASLVASRDRLVAAVASGTLTGDEAKAQLDVARTAIARVDASMLALRDAQQDDRTQSAQRDRLVALAMDFPRAARTLTGPALRELVVPWIAGATFDVHTRTLTLDIRHVPHAPGVSSGDLNQMPCHKKQKTTSRRTVRLAHSRPRGVSKAQMRTLGSRR